MQNYDSPGAAPRVGAYTGGLIASPAPKTALTQPKKKHNPAKNLGQFHHKPKAKRAR